MRKALHVLVFGVPVGVLGILGYIAIAVAWLLVNFGPIKLRTMSAMAMWGFALFGTIFSIYLTYLEPFVIGATCMWCVSSAVVMTLILWAATPGTILLDDDDEDDEDDMD